MVPPLSTGHMVMLISGEFAVHTGLAAHIYSNFFEIKIVPMGYRIGMHEFVCPYVNIFAMPMGFMRRRPPLGAAIVLDIEQPAPLQARIIQVQHRIIREAGAIQLRQPDHGARGRHRQVMVFDEHHRYQPT